MAAKHDLFLQQRIVFDWQTVGLDKWVSEGQADSKNNFAPKKPSNSLIKELKHVRVI